jgi:hypothetical protein
MEKKLKKYKLNPTTGQLGFTAPDPTIVSLHPTPRESGFLKKNTQKN